ncbi:MAG: hypothetical protein IPL52_03890 [Flavobacteriales bacterium]|nr:hypothetical protein [Flavobacteriales bacterium]
MEARDTHDELKDAPFLRSLPKVDPFVAPDGFFDRFPSTVQARIAMRPSAMVVLREWMARSTVAARFAGIAAVVAVIVTAFYFTLRQGPTSESTVVAELAIAPTEIDLDAMDESDLYVLLDEAPEPFSQAVDGLSHEELAAYLEHEELPLDLLIEQL